MAREAKVLRLGRAVRALRRERDLSQEALGGLARVHTNQIGRLERGMNVQVATLLAILEGLDIGLEELGRAYDAQPDDPKR